MQHGRSAKSLSAVLSPRVVTLGLWSCNLALPGEPVDGQHHHRAFNSNNINAFCERRQELPIPDSDEVGSSHLHHCSHMNWGRDQIA